MIDNNITLPISWPSSRIRISVSGIVQGVGFRPFVFKCAKEKGLAGFIKNKTDGVIIEVQGNEDNLKAFLNSIVADHPPLASIADIKMSEIPIAEDTDFVIKDSAASCQKEPLVPPDFSLCGDCLRELFDPSNRRYRYPFINCTNCGPRFTIIKGLPYDRPLTSMASFKMCPECIKEYNNPSDRRFHAEPNACPLCGPKVSWANPEGIVIAEGDDAIRLCEDVIKSGRIAAVKGIGGFHLMTDAANDDAVCFLRNRKNRLEKPFAVIFPFDKDHILSYVKAETFLNQDEKKTILCGERPIVILKMRQGSRLSRFISPGLGTIGVFLPYSPLHYILLEDLKIPLIATSANFSDSPIIKDNQEAVYKLNGIVDGFLLHNRDIGRRCDDSVVVVSQGKTIFLRSSRGYTPHVFKLPYKLNEPALAVGGNQKVTVALGWKDKAVMSQHLGDLATEEGFQAFEHTIQDLTDFYNIKPLRIVCDMHPGYISTKWALSQSNVKHISVQHHHAHIAACMLDNNLTEKVLGVSWDGSGYGSDGTMWGGEFLIADYKGFERFCTFRKFRLVGGEQAVKEPRRIFLSILYEMYEEGILKQWPEVRGQGSERIAQYKLHIAHLKDIFTETELTLFLQMLQKGFHAPFTTSAGRIFDAVSSLLGICHKTTYEGQGAMMLEERAEGRTGTAYSVIAENVVADSSVPLNAPINLSPSVLIGDGQLPYIFNWEPMLKAMIEDLSTGVDSRVISQNFHETLAQLILSVAKMAKVKRGLNAVCLSGGVFQNKVLIERTVNLLQENGFNAYTHNALPPNDGGISLGQLIVGGSD
ncbi:MAG: carbamoyltransferase HypF [Deltaproteobacteria bacterium]|nr:carbamoyltransferase HypF [Deltaproteobacteria bacterium]